jgi:hypothetical protein
MEKNKKIKIDQALNFLEELSWLLENKRSISLKELPVFLREIIAQESHNNLWPKSHDKSIKNNKHYLVGVLPELFQDFELFKSTSELLDFAESALNIKISRASKRSRNEYIGWIICEITLLNDNQLLSLVEALKNIVGSEFKMKKIKEAKKQPNFSWNEAIIKISNL